MALIVSINIQLRMHSLQNFTNSKHKILNNKWIICFGLIKSLKISKILKMLHTIKIRLIKLEKAQKHKKIWMKIKVINIKI